MTLYWRIVATDEYITQVSNLSLGVQDQIQNKWIEIAQHQNPRDVGDTAASSKHSEYIVVVFPGLAYEFVYKIDQAEKIIRLVNCKRLDILDYGVIDFP